MQTPSRICPICMEYEPHYCAAIIRISNVRLPRKQGQRTKWKKTIVITDRMRPYERVTSTRITISKGGES